MRRHTARLVLYLSLPLVVGACLDVRGRSRAPGSALWVSSGAQELARESLDRLASASVREVFLESAELVWEGKRPALETLPGPELPARTPVTLVVVGSWPRGGPSPEAAAQRLATDLLELKIEAEAKGLVPVGFHFDVEASSSLEGYGETLDALRGEIEEQLFLSASVQAEWLESPGMETLVDGVHYLVAFLYGQRMEEPEDSRRWDLAALEERVQLLEEMGTDYFVGVTTLGSLSHVGRNEEPLARISTASLAPLLRDRALELQAAFAFEGFYRQILDLEAKRSTRFGDWTIRPGDQLRVVRPTTPNIAALVKRLAELEVEGHLGQVYYRVPLPEEELSLRPEHLVSALGPEEVTPELEVEVERLRRTASNWRLKVRLHNRGIESTALALQELNYVELKVDGGIWGRVSLGDFRRFAMSNSRNPDLSPMQAIRTADVLHLHYPIVDGGWSVESGSIELRLKSRTPEITLGGEFVLPGGGSFKIPPKVWDPNAQ